MQSRGSLELVLNYTAVILRYAMLKRSVSVVLKCTTVILSCTAVVKEKSKKQVGLGDGYLIQRFSH